MPCRAGDVRSQQSGRCSPYRGQRCFEFVSKTVNQRRFELLALLRCLRPGGRFAAARVFQGNPDKVQYRLQGGAREDSTLDRDTTDALSPEPDRGKKGLHTLVPRLDTLESRLPQP